MRHIMTLAALLLILVVVGVAGYVRLAPDDVARWHVAVPDALGRAGKTALVPEVAVVPGGAVAFVPDAAPADALRRLAAVAQMQPRTQLLAGSVAEGRMTWVARSRVWGFPDYITAEVAPTGLRLWSRQRYGRADYGVNATRLADWIAGL